MALIVAAVVAVATLAGCGGPDQEELMANTTDSRQAAIAAADHIGDLIVRLNPDLNLELDHKPSRDDRWSSCSDWPTADDEVPPLVQWTASRTYYVDPPRETGSLIDPVVAALVTEGWTAHTESIGNGGRRVRVSTTGMTADLGGDTEVIENLHHSIGVIVYGACLDAPEDMLEQYPKPW